jgi:hypothetical protein
MHELTSCLPRHSPAGAGRRRVETGVSPARNYSGGCVSRGRVERPFLSVSYGSSFAHSQWKSC